MRLRYVAALNPPVSGLTPADAGTEISFLPLDRVWADGGLDLSETIEFGGDHGSYSPVLDGDVLLPKVSPTFAAGRVAIAHGLTNGRALATSEVFVVRATHGEGARFLSYRLRARDFLSEGQASWTGVAGLKRISAEFVRNTRIDSAAWSRRGQIADFLDCECERIGAMEGLLAEHRRAGVELERRVIDDLFAGVPLTRLGWRASIQTGLTLGGKYVGEELVEYPYLRVANVQADAIATADVATVRVPARLAKRTTLRPGDVLMTEGGDIDKLGRGAVWDGSIADCLHQNHVFAVRCGDRLLPDFLAVWTRSSVARSFFERTASRITNIASTNLTKLVRLPVPDLPVADQRAKLRAFDREHHRIMELRGHTMQLASGLAEYRDALITEAVTGKLNPRQLSEQRLDESVRAVTEGMKPEILPA